PGPSIKIPADSRLILYPHDDVSVNPFNVSPALRRVLEPDELPEVALKRARAVELDDSGGDVMLFPGSAVWHYRRNASNAVNLYLKLNDFDSDPLGEDPSTPQRRARTLEALAARDGLDGHVVAISRRLDTVTREHTRNAWEEVVTANVWDEKPFRVSEDEFGLLRAVDGRRTVGELA